jgi:hypothetical protein
MDRAHHYEEKRMESDGRKDGSDKGLNSRNGKEKELVHRKRTRAGRIEGLYNGKVKETFKKGKQSVSKMALSKPVRKLLDRDVSWED